MAIYSKILQLVSGISTTIDLSVNTLSLGALQLNGSTSGTLTQNAAATTTSYAVNWPDAQGSASTYLQNDGSGNLSWAAAVGGANTSLSNLTTTSINESLIPASNLSKSLGSSSAVWSDIWVQQILYPSQIAFRLDTGSLYNSTGSLVANFSSNLLSDNSQVASVDWQNRYLKDATGGTSADYSNRFLEDSNQLTSVDWQNRYLIDSGTNNQVIWSQLGVAFPQLTSLTVPYLSSSKILTSSAVTPTQLGYLAGASGTTGTGSLVFSASPTLTGTLTAAAASLTGALNMNSNQINGLASPSLSTDAANKGYVDAAINGLTWKGPVEAYSDVNVALTGSTPLVIDGYTVNNGDLVLLGNQTTASQNGEYSMAISGSTYTLTANGLPDAAGDAWLVLDGATYGNSAFVAAAAVPAATFVEFAGPSSYIFSAPLSLSGNTVSISQASGSANGYLSSTDWNTFNDKQAAGDYITALTGDATASGPGSSVLTLATVNSDVGSYTNASITVNAKGLITAASSGSTAVTAVSVASANGLAGSSSGGATPELTLSTSVTGILQGDGTAISAATTTGAGDVVLNDGPTFSGTVTMSVLTVQTEISTPAVTMAGVYGGAATLAANTTYAMRFGLVANGETAGQLYVADYSTSSYDLFWVIGLFSSATSTTTGTSITVTTSGSILLGSSDTDFDSSDQGAPVWLGSSGAYIANSAFSPSSGDANMKLGMAMLGNYIYVSPQMMGIS